MPLLKGLGGFLLIGIVVWWLQSCADDAGKRELARILREEPYCTENTQHACIRGGYVVLTTDAPSLQELANTGNLSRYLPADACQHDKFYHAPSSEGYVRFCKLERVPTSYSEHEKFEQLRN